MKTVESHACAGGMQLVLEAPSTATGTTMRFALFVPEQATGLLVFLSGLTCSEQNVITKGHFQAAANAAGLAVLCPDTSPRGDEVADVPQWDMGQGASFYLDATQEPYKAHYQMRTYLIDELIPAVQKHLSLSGKVGITGHSMGGHGALVLGVSHPELFGSVSAISPIASATRCPWGHKALPAYLGDDEDAWAAQDASLLLASRGWSGPILVDQGLADSFIDSQLKPELLEQAAQQAGVSLTLNRHEGYDHSYYFVSTVLAQHVAFHAAQLCEA